VSPLATHPDRGMKVTPARAVVPPRERGLRRGWKTFSLALKVRSEPLAFYRYTAWSVLEQLEAHGLPVAGSRVLDLGAGTGAVAELLRAAGARTVALDRVDARVDDVERTTFVLGSGLSLPFRDEAVDGVVCSNVLEHVSDTWGLVGELSRVVRPGGFIYLSWTNWLSPFGGHEWSPFHYLGSHLGLRTYQWVRGRPPRWNVPGRTLFVVHIGPVLRGLSRLPLEVVATMPRYWPSLRFVMKVPGVREVASWNCVVILRRSEGSGARS
jgi:SAM-dependent methyltransferase